MSNISWKEYTLFMVAALFLYYAWVLLIFYSKNIVRIIKQKPSVSNNAENENESAELFGIIYRVQDDVMETLTDAAQKKHTREQIIPALRAVLEKYQLASTPFRFAINNFIERQCQNNCSIHLSEEELRGIW